MKSSKKEKKVLSHEKKKELVSSILTFVIVLVIAGAILSSLSLVLGETIEKTERQPFISAMKKLCPADKYEELAFENAEASGVYNMHVAYVVDDIVGYCVESKTHSANGELRLAVSSDAEGRITAVEIISRGKEDASGTKAQDKEFLSQFAGKNGQITLARGTVKDDTQVREVIGMTVSPEAVCDGVNRASAIIGHLKKGEGKAVPK